MKQSNNFIDNSKMDEYDDDLNKNPNLENYKANISKSESVIKYLNLIIDSEISTKNRALVIEQIKDISNDHLISIEMLNLILHEKNIIICHNTMRQLIKINNNFTKKTIKLQKLFKI